MMRVLRRNLLTLAAAGAGSVVLSRLTPAWAGTARTVSVRELVERSDFAFVGTALGAAARWEEIGGSKRIVTYTTLGVEHPLDGRSPGTELVVRTLGGRVGDIGQIVHGEAPLILGKPSVLFVTRGRSTRAHVVTGMAQGHYPLSSDTGDILRLRLSPGLPQLIDAPRAAIRELPGKTVSQVEGIVFAELPHGR